MVFWQAVATFDLRVRVPRSSDQLTGAVGNANSFAFSFKREQLIKYFTACRFQMYFNFIFLHLLEPILRVGSPIRQSVRQLVTFAHRATSAFKVRRILVRQSIAISLVKVQSAES